MRHGTSKGAGFSISLAILVVPTILWGMAFLPAQPMTGRVALSPAPEHALYLPLVVCPVVTPDPSSPDLVVRYIYGGSSSAPWPCSNSWWVDVAIANRGNGPAGAFDTTVMGPGGYTRQWSLPGLAAGDSQVFTESNPPLRLYAIYQAMVDSADRVRESDENNNLMVAEATMRPSCTPTSTPTPTPTATPSRTPTQTPSPTWTPKPTGAATPEPVAKNM